MANENTNPQQLKSTCKRIKEFDFNEEVVIGRLSVTPDAVNFHLQRMKETFPNMTEQEIWNKVNAIIIRDNVFNAAMQKIVPCYEMHIDQQEIIGLSNWLKNNNPSLANANDNILAMIAQRMIEKQLVFEDVQKLWNITVSNEEVINMLRKMYEETNHPIREIINDQAKIDALKPTLLEQKTADVIISHLKYRLDWESIKRVAEEAAKANMAAAAATQGAETKPAEGAAAPTTDTKPVEGTPVEAEKPKTEENK